MIEVRFKDKSNIIEFVVSALAVIVSIGTMIYGVWFFGIRETWPELVLNVFYIACAVIMWLYFFKIKITPVQFNYWSSVCVGVTVLLRDIIFPPPLDFFVFNILCLILSVFLIMLLTYFYARKEWKTYSKNNLWLICIIDMAIAILYTIDILITPVNEYTEFSLTEIWIRPTITYGLVSCFVAEAKESKE